MFASDLTSVGATWVKKEPKYYCVDLTYDKKANSTKASFYVATETGKDVGRELIFVGIGM